eukprot:484746_1
MLSSGEKFLKIIQKDGYDISNLLIDKIKKDCMEQNVDQKYPIIRICYLCCVANGTIQQTLPMYYSKSFTKTYGFGHRCDKCEKRNIWINSQGLRKNMKGKCGFFIDCNVETFQQFVNRLYVEEEDAQVDNKNDNDNDVDMESKETDDICHLFSTTAVLTMD